LGSSSRGPEGVFHPQEEAGKVGGERELRALAVGPCPVPGVQNVDIGCWGDGGEVGLAVVLPEL